MINLIFADIIFLKCYDDVGGCSHTAIKGPNPTTQGKNFSFQIVSFFSVRILRIRYFHTHGILTIRLLMSYIYMTLVA